MKNDILESFGKLLVKEVRDRAMKAMEMGMQDFYIDDSQKELFEKISLTAIDRTIFKLFVMLEENEDELNLSYQNNVLIDISDGLGGEYLGDWIDNYSKYKSVI